MNNKLTRHKFLYSIGTLSFSFFLLTVLSAAGCNSKNKAIELDKYKLPEKSFYVQNDYYKALEGLNGVELYKALIANQHKYISGIKPYNYLKNIYKDAFKDLYFENDKSLLDIYSENPKGKDPYNYAFGNFGSSAESEGMGFNREHLVPQSWFKNEKLAKQDAHHVWPTDILVNSKRGDYPFGTVNKSQFTSKNGTKVNSSFAEPINEFKGDIARAYLYFALTHASRIGLHSQGREVFAFSNDRPLVNKYFEAYTKWAKDDKISLFDVVRNNEIAKHQGGLRNPFSDYPELIDLLINPGKKVFINKGILKTDIAI
ncbi:Ribonuclease [Mycoplasmopsis agalactiae 14628]|uniref:Ribonuclease n=1 Tax=Mycoplasmopsis agalactiae 14628 TaxID=1110504 RepID=I5D5P2_MYCAA|nr:endonuclease [Mycoplasmopsis agalactiae]EIN15001.1 Ribonuclease [Mycoplasmopsis agalactiae 14628]